MVAISWYADSWYSTIILQIPYLRLSVVKLSLSRYTRLRIVEVIMNFCTANSKSYGVLSENCHDKNSLEIAYIR